MSYAESWNAHWKGPRTDAPTTIWVDGVHEEHEEQEAKMEVEDELTVDAEQLLLDIHTGRHSASSMTFQESDLMHATEIDTDFTPPASSANSLVLVLDTNVLVSRLNLLKEIVSSRTASIILVVPGIVIQELDGLRQSKRSNIAHRLDGSTTSVGVASLAKLANDWLLPIINKTPTVRGQRANECPRGNWMYNRDGMDNDDLVIECANYYVQGSGLPRASVLIFTYDRNLQLKAGVEGYSCLSPPQTWTAADFLGRLGVQAPSSLSSPTPHSSERPDWARAPPVKKKTRPKDVTKNIPAPTMELDGSSSHRQQNVPPSHPLSVVHDQLRVYLIATLPGVVAQGVEQLRQLEEEERGISIHARTKGRPPIPSEEEQAGWTPSQSILWLDKVLPAAGCSPSAARKLAEFVKPYGENGGRRGQDWARGDWLATCDSLDRYCCGAGVGRELREAVERAYEELGKQPMR